MFGTTTIRLYSHGQTVTVHLLSTGAVAVKNSFRENKRAGIAAIASFVLDTQFTEWLPIHVMVVEHPEGIFIIDTGEVAAVTDKDYFKSSGLLANWFDRSQFRFSVNQDDEIDKQLESLCLPTEKVKAVVLTHLHFDHTDGITHFPNVPILVSQKEWQKPYGDLPKLYPSWFAPQLVDITERYDVFSAAHFLTAAKDMVWVETPGHTWHHTSVLLQTDECFLLFAADICYTQQQLVRGTFPGNNASNRLAKATYDTVKTFAKHYPLVFIPSHDGEAAKRLSRLETL